MFKIGEFSKLSNSTIRALHYYEEKELLKPEIIDRQSNFRYYSAKQLTTVNQIKMLQQIGLPLATIKEILASNDLKLLDYHYELRELELQRELEQVKKNQRMVELLQNGMKEGKNMAEYNVVLKSIPERQVMSIRKEVTSFDKEGKMWHDLYEQSLAQKVKLTSPPAGMTLFHDKEYKETDIDIEIQSNVIGNYENKNEICYYNAPSFQMAATTFNGSYEQMPAVTQALASWIEANNYQMTGVMINIPIVSPAQEKNPENWVTEAGFIVTPVETN
ncbi:MerR family transcriptional regulator [Enterococcus sp. LJL99]